MVGQLVCFVCVVLVLMVLMLWMVIGRVHMRVVCLSVQLYDQAFNYVRNVTTDR